ncbi:MAG: M56 family metallopeptidase [Planctomycetaceae bacterium]|nr:M56 family metallopeptidase [Planctomycetaceae bacterium]
MNGYHSILLWCEFQVGCIAILGIVLSFLFTRKSPRLAGSVVTTTLLIASVLTLIAPLPQPRWIPSRVVSWFDVSTTSLQTNAVDSSHESAGTGGTDVKNSDSEIDLGRVLSSLRLAQLRINRLERNHNSVTVFASVVLLLFVAIGLVRLAKGVHFIRGIRRKSFLIKDTDLLDHLTTLSNSLGCRSIPRIHECPEFTDAAVVGWRDPIVILPGHWRTWSDDEVQAVLAHETAHIARRDVAWRILATLLLSVHYFNPLLHWLLSRLRFCQELATDEAASRAVGHRIYLRSLSALALRQDEFIGRKVAPNMLPVFSGQLIRRIKMLDSWKNASNRQGRLSQLAVTSMLLIVGIVLVVTRGMAHPPATESKLTPSPIRTVSFTRSVSDDKPQPDPTRDMFRHAPLDPSLVGVNSPQGMVSIRLHDLTKIAEIRAFLPAINASLSQSLGKALEADSEPSISLENIEWAAARPHLRFRKITSKDETVEEPKTDMAFGASCFAVKLTQPLDLKKWFETHAPHTIPHTIEGRSVYQLKLPAVGPASCFVWMQDEKTLRMNSPGIETVSDDTTLSDLSQDSHTIGKKESADLADSTPVEWIPTWQRIDQGLASVVMNEADLTGLLFDFENRKSFQTETLDAVEKALLALKARCQRTACSFDIASSPSQMGLRISLVHASHEDSLKSAADLRVLLKQSQAFLLEGPGEPADDPAEEALRRKAVKVLTDGIEASTISIEDYEDQTSAVVLSSALPFSRLLEFVIPSPSTN